MTDLREAQAPLKEQYEQDPEKANVTLTATGEEVDDARACSVDIGRAIYEAELHEGVGGPGTAACSGDLLLGALAACTQLTAQAVAEAFELDVDVNVQVDGDLDLRGTLGLDDDVPVGFTDINLTVTVTGNLDPDTADALQKYTEKYCVVYQTLIDSPGVTASWSLHD